MQPERIPCLQSQHSKDGQEDQEFKLSAMTYLPDDKFKTSLNYMRPYWVKKIIRCRGVGEDYPVCQLDLLMAVSRVEGNTQATYGIPRNDWENDEFQKLSNGGNAGTAQKSKRKVGLDDVF